MPAASCQSGNWQLATGNCPAFTLLEMLVVMGILLVLLSLLLPVLARARRQAMVIATRSDFAAIGAALEAYRNDFNDYPRNGQAPTSLGGALLSPDNLDGCDGYGMRVVQAQGDPGYGGRGRVYGPYLRPDQFKLVKAGSRGWLVLDRWGGPILYYPRYGALEKKPTIRASERLKIPILRTDYRSQYGCAFPAFVALDGMLQQDNAGEVMQLPMPVGDDYMGPSLGVVPYPNWRDRTEYGMLCGQVFRYMVGDEDADSYIDPARGERLRCTDPYVLISGGPDGEGRPAYSGLTLTGFNWGFTNWATQRKMLPINAWGQIIPMLDDDVVDPAFVHGQYLVPDKAKRRLMESDDIYSFERE